MIFHVQTKMANTSRVLAVFISKPEPDRSLAPDELPMPKWLVISVFLCVFLIPVVTAKAELDDRSEIQNPQTYLDELVKQSVQKKLSGQRYWHLLLHYRRNILGGYTSEADGPGFFLSPDGRKDPQAELVATLAQFFSDDLVGTSRQQAQCAFPARYHWLKEKLNFDGTRLPERDCERFRNWLGTLDPGSVTLIFASAYMNNPPSMFGHTLLRIDQHGQTEGTRLLAYTINYAATPTTQNAIAAAFLGSTGWFKGYFSTYPYYIKVKEYNDMENRDLWEYRLNLNPDQIHRILMHTWELGNTYFNYYFFTENCSYHLMSLLEVADPNIHLTDDSRFWIIPADTVRWITEQPGLVSEVIYRPSRNTQIRRKRELLTKSELAWLRRIRTDPQTVHEERFADLPMLRQALVMDVAYDYLQYLSISDDENQESYKKMQRNLLQARSALKIPSEEVEIHPFTSPPEKGHRTVRAGIGVGWRDDEPFEELTVRPAYHDMMDDETGYAPGAQIEVLGISVRHYNHRDRTKIENLTLINIASLSPVDSLFKALSWKFNTGLHTIKTDNCGYCNYWNSNFGTGGAIQTELFHRELFYAFAEGDLNYGSAFEKDYRMGGGGTLGMLADLTPRWKLHLSTTYLSFPLGERSHEFRASLEQRYTLQKDLAVRLELNHDHRQNESLLKLDFYF